MESRNCAISTTCRMRKQASTFLLVKPSTFVSVKQVISTTCRMRKQVRAISGCKALQLVGTKVLTFEGYPATHRLSVWLVMALAVMWMVLLICAAETLKSCGGVHEHGHGGHDDHGEHEHADQHGSVHEQVHADADKHE